MDMLKGIIKRILPNCILDYVKYFYHSRCLKRKIGGEKVYIFQLSSFGVGLLCVYRWGLAEVKKFKDKGYKVVIDYEEPKNIDNKSVGKENLWNSVFKQPSGISVEQALNMDTIVLVSHFTYNVEEVKICKEYDRKYYMKMNERYKNTLPLKENLVREWDIEFRELFKDKRVLGVTLRELFRIMHENNTGWSSGHPNEPDTDNIIKIIKKYLDKNKCDYFFLATEFEDSLQALKKTFGKKLLYIDRYRKKITQDYINDVIEIQNGECNKSRVDEIMEDEANSMRMQKNIDYVKEIYGLTKCNCLLGTPSNGMLVALLWNAGKYEDVSFFGEVSMEGRAYF